MMQASELSRSLTPKIKMKSRIASHVFPRHSKYHYSTSAFMEIAQANDTFLNSGTLKKYNESYVNKFHELTGRLIKIKNEIEKCASDKGNDLKIEKRKLKATLYKLWANPEDKELTVDQLIKIEDAEAKKVNDTIRHLDKVDDVLLKTGGLNGMMAGFGVSGVLSGGVLPIVISGVAVGGLAGARLGHGLGKAIKKFVLKCC